MAGHRRFPEELFRTSVPELCPEQGRFVLSRTPGMLRMEAKMHGRALEATVGATEQGIRAPVSPEDVLAVLFAHCGVRRCDVKVEVSAPLVDFLLRFRNEEECTVMLHLSRNFVVGSATLSFGHWHRSRGARTSELEYLSKLTFERFPREAWERDSVGRFINRLGGHLEEMLKPTDSWYLSVTAWMKNPSDVPKSFVMEVPEPDVLPPVESDSNDPTTPSPPRAPTMKRTVVHDVLVHVSEVVDRGPVFTDLPVEYQDLTVDTTRTHEFIRYESFTHLIATKPSPTVHPSLHQYTLKLISPVLYPNSFRI
ncbi:hypothetical protein ACQ4PT_060928 [Festuca glaucescens]